MQQKSVSMSAAIRQLNQVLFPDRKDVVAMYIFALFAGLVQLSLPLGIQSIINFVMAGTFSTSIAVLIGLVVFGVFIAGLLQVRQLQLLEKVKQKVFVRYSLEYSDRIPKLNIEKLDGEYLPELTNRYFDTVSLQKSMDKLLIDLPGAIIQVTLGLLLLAFYHPIFIGFGLFLMVTVASIIRFTSPQGLRTALKASSYKYKMAAWLQEIARSIKSFKYTKGTSLHMNKSDKVAGKYLESRTAHFRILLTQFWSLISFRIVITAAMLIIGAYLLVNQQINVGQFIAADIVIIAIIASIEKVITNLDSIYDALVSVEKLNAIAGADLEESGTVKLAPEKEGVDISFKNVHFAYENSDQVLRGISLDIQKQQIVQLKGASGSGKSTVLRLLTGAFSNFEGDILLNGVPLSNYNVESLRAQTGILLSVQDIFEGSLWDNITMGNKAVTLEQVSKLAELCGLQDFIRTSRNGYDSKLLPVGNKLSRNVRKNILLMRALLGPSRLMLLEEPFEHLREPYRSNMINYIRQEKNATIVIASEDERLAPHCDKIIQLDNQQ
ncbi:MAG: peptidase domain-containing ABC transporter [Chitinophagaceae bacterium]